MPIYSVYTDLDSATCGFAQPFALSDKTFRVLSLHKKALYIVELY
jgi:hypothetical protein